MASRMIIINFSRVNLQYVYSNISIKQHEITIWIPGTQN